MLVNSAVPTVGMKPPMSTPAPMPAPIVRPRLPRVLRPRRRICRRAGSPGRRARAASVPTTTTTTAAPTATPSSASPATGLRHVVVHAFPGRGAALLVRLHLLRFLRGAARLLLFVLLLLEGELVLRVVARRASLASLEAGAGTRAHRTTAASVEVASSAAALLGLNLGLLHLHLLHLLHLLQHGGVHALHAALGAWTLGEGGLGALLSAHLSLLHLLQGFHLLHLLHLLHHSWVHSPHASHASHTSHASVLHCGGGHLLLHGGEVLLHLLPVLRHHLRRHAAHHVLATLLVLIALVLVRIVEAAVVVSEVFASTAPTAPTAAALGFFFFAHVTSRLRFFDFDGLAEDLEIACKSGIDGCFAIESNEAETPRTASVLVHHESGVDNTPELGEVLFKDMFVGVLTDTSNEDLACAFLFITRNSPLGVNLGRQ